MVRLLNRRWGKLVVAILTCLATPFFGGVGQSSEGRAWWIEREFAISAKEFAYLTPREDVADSESDVSLRVRWFDKEAPLGSEEGYPAAVIIISDMGISTADPILLVLHVGVSHVVSLARNSSEVAGIDVSVPALHFSIREKSCTELCGSIELSISVNASREIFVNGDLVAVMPVE